MSSQSSIKCILLISPYWKEQHRWMVSTVKLAELWQRLGYRVVVACMGSTTRTEVMSETLTVHFRKDIFLPDPWNYGIAFGFSGFVRRLATKENPDVIVVNKLLFWSSLVTIPLRLSGKKVIVLTDALVGITWWPRGFIPKVGAAIYAWTLGWLILKMASRVVFFHPQAERIVRRLRISNKVEIIPTGIDPSPYEQAVSSKLRAMSDTAQNSLRQSSGQAPLKTHSSTTVTYVGRLESVKGVDDYLAAVTPLKKEFPSLNIQVVGWYKDRHPLVKQYERDVRFTGLRDDIPAILGQSDIFVLPSHSEGLSNALMEAMASGCACIASEVGGNAFLIQNGVSGFLFPAGDREALQSHIRRLLKDPFKRKAMGGEARKRIDEVFSWEVVGKKYEALFASFL